LKKLWKNYSYAIILVILTLVTSIIIKINIPSDDQYMTITVMKGETLWEIAQKYEDQHGLSKVQFIKWVEKHNGVTGDHIVAGNDLVLPIVNEPLKMDEVRELASN